MVLWNTLMFLTELDLMWNKRKKSLQIFAKTSFDLNYFLFIPFMCTLCRLKSNCFYSIFSYYFSYTKQLSLNLTNIKAMNRRSFQYWSILDDYSQQVSKIAKKCMPVVISIVLVCWRSLKDYRLRSLLKNL